MTDWQRIAKERLREIHDLRRRHLIVGQEVGRIVRDRIAFRLHAGCLAGLGDLQWQQFIAQVAQDVEDRVAGKDWWPESWKDKERGA